MRWLLTVTALAVGAWIVLLACDVIDLRTYIVGIVAAGLGIVWDIAYEWFV